jgi:hypothetical protein
MWPEEVKRVGFGMVVDMRRGMPQGWPCTTGASTAYMFATAKSVRWFRFRSMHVRCLSWAVGEISIP